MDYFYGIIGFVGFESLRIYKLLWADLPIAPHRRKFLYMATLICVAAFSSFVAHAFADGNAARAIFVGFSVPTGLKAIFENPRRGRQLEQSVDDIEISRANIFARILYWFDTYYRFK